MSIARIDFGILLPAVLAFVVLSSPNLTDASEAPGFDEFGLRLDPTCVDQDEFEDFYVHVEKQSRSSRTAETMKWRMYVYENQQTREWTVAAQKKGPGTTPGEYCILATGEGDYTAQKWFRKYFARTP